MNVILKFKYYGTPCNVKKIQTGHIERFPIIAELVISPYLKISQQFMGLKNFHLELSVPLIALGIIQCDSVITMCSTCYRYLLFYTSLRQ